jgi:uncharacterized protein YkwD
MHKPKFPIAVSLLLVLFMSMLPKNTQAQPAIESGADVLAAVNALRASRGLPAYAANPILMQIAQAQADYLAATNGAYGHVGPGGTAPRDRAAAAGYSAAFFSENWYGASGLSASGVVSIWQNMDSDHLNTMISPNMVEAGAGVSKSGGTTYYVLDAGAAAGAAPVGTSAPGTLVAPGTPIVSQYSVPVTLNTPDAHGVVYHEVAYGQALWSIAIAYGTTMNAIRQLNHLGDTDMIYVGQKLVVLVGPTPAPATPTLAATQTLAPVTVTSAPTETQPVIPSTASATAVPAANSSPSGGLNLTAILIIMAALLFAALGTWLGTRRAA